MSFDTVIRNGTVVDGTGLAPYRADVGIVDGRIAEIGRIKERGATDLDADGHVVTPGFIESHTHMDAQVFWDGLGTNSCWHGVTTAVMGHCGFTLAPTRDDAHELVVRNLERAEDIAPAALAAGIEWSWTDFAGYLDALDRLPKGLNYAANLGHSALRTYVMGERAFEGEATSDDIAAMKAELEAGMRAGAFGFTTSRTKHHQTSDDRPVASRLASWSEVCELVGVLGDLGVGIFQSVSDPDVPEGDPNELLRELALGTGVPIASTAMNLKALEQLERSVAAGVRTWGLCHPRGIGAFTSFLTQTPFDRLPEWRELRALPIEEQRRQLADPDVVTRLVKIADESVYSEAFGAEARPPEFDRMQVFSSPLPPNPTVAEAAAARGVHPVELMIQLALETDLRQLFWQTMAPFDHDAVKQCLAHPDVVLGFSDSGAHVSQMSDSSIHTHFLAHWVREREEFTLPEAVRMLTLEPARAYNFSDRGLVREGMVADLNVFDPATVAPTMPELVYDLPGGARRLVQGSVGFRATLVNGEVLIEDGTPTEARPGRLLRGAGARRG
ncbi:MAG: amidohydrolase family protein [Acidimicrobiia bacterium]